MPDWQTVQGSDPRVAGIGAVVLALSVMGRPSGSTDVASAATPAPAPPSGVPSTPALAAPGLRGASDVSHVPIEEAPGWIMPRRAGYASDGSRLLTLQVAALRDLQVSREYIRPILAVRCLSRRTEVFVSLGTSAQIEASDTNRVTVQLDSQTSSAQQWLRTDTYQELFAPMASSSLANSLARA